VTRLRRLWERSQTRYNSFIMGKLVIIDGNAILHRAFHAMPPLTTKGGEPINAVYGLVSMFLRIVQDLKPESIAVAFDEKEKTFRHIEFKNYQAQRPPVVEELSSQFEKAKDFFKAAGVPIYSKPGFEADDVIGTIADKSRADVVVVTGDRDLLQLVGGNIRLYMPVVGLTNAKLYDEASAKERMGVAPEQIPDYKALVGDPSDNYPGVAGIGPKTAEKLLEKYGSIDKIYAHIKDIEPKLRQKLVDGESQAKLFYRLATVVKDVPLDIDFKKMGKWRVDSPEVLNLFEKFGFKTLTERVKKVGDQINEEKQTSLF
jgi:DNA polymerase-1